MKDWFLRPGIVESSNDDVFRCLFIGKWMEDHKTHHWAEGLPSVIFSINNRTSFSTKKTPYELVFGQDARANSHYWKSVCDSSILHSTFMKDLMIDTLEPTDESVMDEQPQLSTCSDEGDLESG